MKKSILEVYALAVCFATIVCFVIVLGIAFYDLIEISNPEFTLSSYEYNRHQSNDAFWKSYQCSYDKKEKETQRPSDEELTRQRWESYQQEVKSERRGAFQSLTRSSIILAIDIFAWSIGGWLVVQDRQILLPNYFCNLIWHRLRGSAMSNTGDEFGGFI